MKQQHTPSSFGQGDWDRERDRNETDPRAGAGSPEHGRPHPQSGPGGYPESHYRQQAQRDHPGIEYYSGSPGYGGRDDERRQQQGQGGYGASPPDRNYGGGPWSRSESEYRSQPERHPQEAFQPGARQQGYGEPQPYQQNQGYGETGRWTSGYGQYGGGWRDSFQGGQFQDSRMVDRQAEQFGRNFGHLQQDQFLGSSPGQEFHGYGGRMSGQSEAGQSSRFGGRYGEPPGEQPSPGYGGFRSGQPQDYGGRQGRSPGHGSQDAAQQPVGGYGSYGAYQVGSQPQSMGRSVPRPPRDYARSDERIRELICEHLALQPGIDASDVSVQVKDGRVTLEGTVPDRRMKHEIEDVADACWGVKDVDNRIRAGRQSERSGLPDNAARGWLAAPADVLTGGASTEAAADNKKTRPEDMAALETGAADASGRDPAGTGGKAQGK